MLTLEDIMKKKLKLIILSFALILLVINCGGGGGSSSSTTATDNKDDNSTPENTSITYRIADTGQKLCFNSTTGASTACTGTGYDADYSGNQPNYTADTATVTDNVTGLMWTRSTDLDGDNVYTDAGDKLSFNNAATYCANLSLGGYSDWRLPDIKTLYSLILFTGTDPSSYTGTDTSSLTTFLDPIFTEAFGDMTAGERIIDAQYASSTEYVYTTMNGNDTVFGVNFVDGRIKGYPKTAGATEKLFYVLCVRGNTSYGVNNFTDNGDQTITDTATGLMWQKNDTTSSNFDDAVSKCESESTASHTDWRLPNAKELHSITDYSRSPDTTNSPAISSMFNSTSFINEAGVTDWGYFWSSTTHAKDGGSGDAGAYVSFGRALGYMNGNILDVHGAGAQRSNAKMRENEVGASSAEGVEGTFYYKGPQGDILRIDNMVRCVRDNG
ncbi:MAG: hypothetical protein C0602_01150 [Denitrovibrio sp.]|nr:MAG: hypothetical protein C0602_01150 [Denitrovibrio sp.]